jgi:hypothetical protein
MADVANDLAALAALADVVAQDLNWVASATIAADYQLFLLGYYGADYLDGYAKAMRWHIREQTDALTNLAGAWSQWAALLTAILAGLAPYDFPTWLRDVDHETDAKAETFGEHVLTLLDTMIVANE